MSSHVATLYGREHRGVGQRDRLPEIEHVGCGALALLLVGGVDLVLAGGVGLRRVHLDAVLVGERLDDGAVVGPVRRQRDDIELALLLGGLDEAVHAAEVLGRGGLAGLHARFVFSPPFPFSGGAQATRPASTTTDAAQHAVKRRAREERIGLEYLMGEPSDGQEAAQWRMDNGTKSPR